MKMSVIRKMTRAERYAMEAKLLEAIHVEPTFWRKLIATWRWAHFMHKAFGRFEHFPDCVRVW